eukprot:4982128-Lingulodinium_polyedra.AAC.1
MWRPNDPAKGNGSVVSGWFSCRRESREAPLVRRFRFNVASGHLSAKSHRTHQIWLVSVWDA